MTSITSIKMKRRVLHIPVGGQLARACLLISSLSRVKIIIVTIIIIKNNIIIIMSLEGHNKVLAHLLIFAIESLLGLEESQKQNNLICSFSSPQAFR